MIVKIVTLFLVGMAVLAVLGRLRYPRRVARVMRRDCPRCGTPRVGAGRCPCGKA